MIEKCACDWGYRISYIITYFFGSYLPQSSFWPANEPSNSVGPNSANPSQRPEANLGLVMEISEHNEMRSFYEEILHYFFHLKREMPNGLIGNVTYSSSQYFE